MIKHYIVVMKIDKKKITYSVFAPSEEFIRSELIKEFKGEIVSIEPNKCCVFKISEEEEK